MIFTDTIKFNKNNVKMVAHRGVSGLELENTNAAFIAAGNRSYFGIETDVHRTKDGRYIIIHDEDTKRVSSTNINVEESDFEVCRNVQLRDIDGTEGRTDLYLPSLREYIRTCKRYDKVAVLELKNEFPFEDVENICREITAENYLHNVVFISFFMINLDQIRRILPEQPVQFLTEEYSEEMILTLQKKKMDLDIQYKLLTKENVEFAHSKGVKVNCWTVNDKETGERLVSYGVDFITTNILE